MIFVYSAQSTLVSESPVQMAERHVSTALAPVLSRSFLSTATAPRCLIGVKRIVYVPGSPLASATVRMARIFNPLGKHATHPPHRPSSACACRRMITQPHDESSSSNLTECSNQCSHGGSR